MYLSIDIYVHIYVYIHIYLHIYKYVCITPFRSLGGSWGEAVGVSKRSWQLCKQLKLCLQSSEGPLGALERPGGSLGSLQRSLRLSGSLLRDHLTVLEKSEGSKRGSLEDLSSFGKVVGVPSGVLGWPQGYEWMGIKDLVGVGLGLPPGL